MKSSPSILSPVTHRRRLDSVALVITLLLLSVITFLAIAFLAMSRRNQSTVVTAIDNTTSQALAQAAQQRAIAEIMAKMLAGGDVLNYDYMVSRNAINPAGFVNNEKTNDPNNVNYDYFTSGALFNAQAYPQQWVQNIANLLYDPRPPVFVVTNPAFPNNYDFRFYVDINRNGRFETNGYQAVFLNENPIAPYPVGVLNGEPEFIGMLRNPLQHHSGVNPFIGRYAYLVLPIGKELDLNYIHNFLKASYGNVGSGNVGVNNLLNNKSIPGAENDGFARDQGMGSWELNLAAFLDDLSPWAYEIANHGSRYSGYITGWEPYYYVPPSSERYNSGLYNTGNAFDDAEAILHYRYSPAGYTNPPLYAPYYGSFTNRSFVLNLNDFNFLDPYCASAPIEAPFDYDLTNLPLPTKKYQGVALGQPWAGSYQTNMFFDPQDLFDPNKTSVYFTNRMILASQRTNTYDRYTFQRLLSSIGVGSSPEYGVWVYGDSDTNFLNLLSIPPPAAYIPSQLRTKVNLNFDNTAQITNGNAPYVAMPTNLVPWQPATFFNNAAELLLRSETFTYTNFTTLGFPAIELMTFGVTNIPIYRASNPGIHYDASVHRMLQLAANIYDATQPTNYDSAGAGLPPVRHPAVFRPIFQLTNAPGQPTNIQVNIRGYVQVTNGDLALIQMLKFPFQDLPTAISNHTFNASWNVAGIPWIVAADKGLPAFYRYTAGSQVMLERKLLFPRLVTGGGVVTNKPPISTNQFFCMSVTNTLGVDAWNPYTNFFSGSLYSGGNLSYYYSNYVVIQIANNYNFVTNIVLDLSSTNVIPLGDWQRGGGPVKSRAGFLSVVNASNIIALPESYFSPTQNRFIFLTNGDNYLNSWLPADLKQTGFPVYNWTISVTNHLVYALFDGTAAYNPNAQSSTALLDFVNLGPFGYSMSITNIIATNGTQNNLGVNGSGNNPIVYWLPGRATGAAGSPISAGVLNQIQEAEYIDPSWAQNLLGQGPDGHLYLGCAYNPSVIIQQPTNWVSNDPLVHYTLEDLTWAANPQTLGFYDTSHSDVGLTPNSVFVPQMSNFIGTVSSRYAPWGANDSLRNNLLYKDPAVINSDAWNFPTNKFPGVGWIGRVHRGTPWQTVYLKSDGPTPFTQWSMWSSWANPNYINTLIAPETYPTNDYPLVDVFTTALNDNAARGLLSVNQTNDPAWAALFGGVIALSNVDFGAPIGNYNVYDEVTNLMDSPYGINAARTNQPNGIFHKVGYILSAPALTMNSPYVITNGADAAYDDEVVERIPQQTLSLLKVGEPQFVIYSWGQALRPKGPPYLPGLLGGANANVYTNYEITGEVLTRTVCHLVHTNGLKMVIDSYNVESGSN